LLDADLLKVQRIPDCVPIVACCPCHAAEIHGRNRKILMLTSFSAEKYPLRFLLFYVMLYQILLPHIFRALTGDN
jgi:hypothetical protein